MIHALHTVFRVVFPGVTLIADPSMMELIENLDPPFYDGVFDFRTWYGQVVMDWLGSPASAFVEYSHHLPLSAYAIPLSTTCCCSPPVDLELFLDSLRIAMLYINEVTQETTNSPRQCDQ
jgi:hypothetical protein